MGVDRMSWAAYTVVQLCVPSVQGLSRWWCVLWVGAGGPATPTRWACYASINYFPRTRYVLHMRCALCVEMDRVVREARSVFEGVRRVSHCAGRGRRWVKKLLNAAASG